MGCDYTARIIGHNMIQIIDILERCENIVQMTISDNESLYIMTWKNIERFDIISM